MAEAGDHRSDDEDDDGGLHQRLLVEQIGEFAPDRSGGGVGEQRRGDDPGVGGLGSLQVADDGG